MYYRNKSKNLSSNLYKSLDKTFNKGIHIHDNIYKLDNSKYCWGAHALLINNSKAKKIYELNCSIKHEIDNHYKFLCDENKLVVLTIYPVIAYQNKMLPSNIS